MNCNMKISVMAALFLTLLTCLAIAAQARTLSSENYWHNKISMIIVYGRPVPSIPSPKLSPSEGQLQTGSPCVAGNPFSSSSSRPFLTTEDGCGKAKLSPPPSPTSSKSPTQSENIVSPCVAGNPCSSSFIAMGTDYGRKKPSTPPSPTSSKSPTHLEIDSPSVACSSSRPSIDMKTDKEKENLSLPPPATSSESPIQTEKTGLPCDIGKAKLSPPPSPASSKSPTQSEDIASPSVAGNPCSSSFIAMETDYGRKKPSTPPSPSSSKSPTQSENIVSPSVAGNPCSSSFIAMETDYGRKKPSTPPPPTSSKSPTHSEIDSPCVACSSSGQFIAIKTDYVREVSKPPVQLVVKAKLSPPPPASSKSPTQSGIIDSPSVDGTGNSCNSFISMVTDQDYGRTKR